MEIVNIEASAFMEMNDILFKIEKQLKGLNSSFFVFITIEQPKLIRNIRV